MSRAGATLVAVTSMVRGSVTWLPARSVGPPEAAETLTDTLSPPLGGVARVRTTVELVGPEQDTAVTAGERPGIETLKAVGETVEQSIGLEKVAVTDGLPPAAWSPVGLGGTVSTVTVRVTAGESWPPMSTERTARVCAPSASAGGWNPQLTFLAGQPVHVTPVVDQGPPSMLASTRTTSPSESAAGPLLGSTPRVVTLASGPPAPG